MFERIQDLDLPPASPVRDIAVVYPGDSNRGGIPYNSEANGALGATKLLCDTHHQFDLVVLPETGDLDGDLVAQLRSFISEGGDLIASGDSTLSADGIALSDVLGVRYAGSVPYSTAYLQFEAYADRIPEQPMVSYDGVADVEPTSAHAVGSVVAPAAARGIDRDFCHRQAPPGPELDVPAATVNEFGDGRAIYLGTSLFSQYFEFDYHGGGIESIS